MKKVLIASGVAVLAFAMIASAASFNTNLTVGSTGADVVALQTQLLASGFVIPALSSGDATKGYFGSQTQTAVKRYQAANGIPSTGFVGPLTRGALNGGGVAMTPATCPAGFTCSANMPVVVNCPVGFDCIPKAGGAPVTGTTGLVGSYGTIATFSQLSQYSTEEVGDGQKDVKVLAFEAKAAKDGDVALQSMKLAFVLTNTSGSTRIADYVNSVSIWLGETRIGTASAVDFNKDSTGKYSKTITLNAGSILRADVTQNIYFTLDGANNLDTGDIDSEVVTLDVENIRYVDGFGVTTTETGVGDLDASGSVATVAFVSFSTSADTILKLVSDSSSPETNIVVVNASSNTDKVILLTGKLKLDGSSKVVLDQFPVTLTTDGDSVGALTGTLTLKIDGKEYSESVGLTAAQTGSVTFDNLDLTINAGETLTFSISADVNDVENTAATSTDFDEGDYLIASVSATNRSYMVVENSAGDALTDATEKTGTLTGKAQSFRTKGIALMLVSVVPNTTTPTSGSFPDSANNDTGLFIIRYTVRAIGDTMYVSSLTTTDLAYVVDKAGVATTSVTIAATLVNNTDATKTTVGNYEISEGTSETFTLAISVPISAASGTGQYRAALTALEWDTVDDTDMTGGTYTSNMDDFKTAYQILN